MVRRVGAITVLLIGATFSPAAPPQSVPPQATPRQTTLIETKFVAAPFCMALVFEPARVDKSATAAGLPIGDAWKLLEGLTDANVKDFERVTTLIEPFPGGNVAFMPAFALRYPTGIDARKKLPTLLGDVKEAKVGEIAYVRSTKYKLAKVEMAGYAIDDRTLLVAAWPTLEAMLKPAEEKKGRPLSAELAKLTLSHDAVLVITPAPLLKRIVEIEKEAGKKTGDSILTSIQPMLEKVAAITVNLDLKKNPLIRAEFRCTDAMAADAVHNNLKDLLKKAKDAYPDMRKDLEKQLLPETAKALLPIFDKVVNEHTLTKTGVTVVLTADQPKNSAPKP